MITKVGVLIDGGFFWQRFIVLNKKEPSPEDVINEVNKIMDKINLKTAGETKDILFRIYYYDCTPFCREIENHDKSKKIDYSKTPIYINKTKYLEKLCRMDRFALRLGELSFSGWKQDIYSKKWKPDFNQKGVDMKFGLDMAWMANKKVIDKVALVAGDSDFIAPIKYVRKEGIQVYLYNMNSHVKDDLIKHCDFLLQYNDQPRKAPKSRVH